MSKKLFVGNLSWNVTEDELLQLFSEYGEVVDHVIMKDRDTGRSRGFAFVTFANPEDADKAVEALNGKEVDGREVVVNEARPRT